MEIVLLERVEKLGQMGDVVRVKVVDVDVARKRIGLTMRLRDGEGAAGARRRGPKPEAGPKRGGKPKGGNFQAKSAGNSGGGALAAAFAKAQKKRG